MRCTYHEVVNDEEDPVFISWRASTLSKIWLPPKPSPLALPDKILLGLIWDYCTPQYVALPAKLNFGWTRA